MRIILASHTNINPELVVGSHHLARAFAALGHSVLHMACPITGWHLLNRNNSNFKKRVQVWSTGGVSHSANLREYIPFSLIPWPIAKRLSGEGQNLFLTTAPSLVKVLKREGFLTADILCIDEPRYSGIEEFVNARRVIYRPTDIYSVMKDDPRIVKMEQLLIRRSDAVVGTSQPVLDHVLFSNVNKPSLLLENGVDYAAFQEPCSKPREYEKYSGARAVYVGAIDQRFDFDAILALADALPGLHIFLLGPVTIPVPKMALNLANIHLLGGRDYRSIPAYLHHADIGLLPMNEHGSNTGRSPMKLYEYAAAGLPVLSKKTTELERRALGFVRLYTDRKSMIESAESLLANRADRSGVKTFAEEHCWDNKALRLLKFIEKPPI